MKRIVENVSQVRKQVCSNQQALTLESFGIMSPKAVFYYHRSDKSDSCDSCDLYFNDGGLTDLFVPAYTFQEMYSASGYQTEVQRWSGKCEVKIRTNAIFRNVLYYKHEISAIAMAAGLIELIECGVLKVEEINRIIAGGEVKIIN